MSIVQATHSIVCVCVCVCVEAQPIVATGKWYETTKLVVEDFSVL